MEFYYIGQPYAHPNPYIRHLRYRLGTIASARILAGDFKSLPTPDSIFAPIPHSHPMSIVGQLPDSWDYWKRFDTPFIHRAKGLIVLELPGWKRSRGLTWEIETAKALDLDTHHVSLATLKSTLVNLLAEYGEYFEDLERQEALDAALH